jgi:D-tyrosyl-tRNA(Tyr) deacylase
VVGKIGPGLLVLAGFEASDADSDLAWMAAKLIRLRIFADANGVMNRSVVEADGELLAVSQFTLFASTRKGNRPSWSRAGTAPHRAAAVRPLRPGPRKRSRTPRADRRLRADMRVHLVNDGPVTISLDSRQPE